MIEFHYESDFQLTSEPDYSDWINRVVESEQRNLGDLVYVFCDDEYLLNMNQKYLMHDTYTDIITFDYGEGSVISGDIFISTDRVWENALKFEATFEEELRRVMVHGVLHLVGYVDKSKDDKLLMRKKEEQKIKMFHVEQ